MSSLPQDCVILCGANISPVKVAQSIGSEYGLVQTYHGGVDRYDGWGKAKELPTVEEEEQEKVGRRWLDGEGGCLVTHNRSFSGCEASTCIFISTDALDWSEEWDVKGCGQAGTREEGELVSDKIYINNGSLLSSKANQIG